MKLLLYLLEELQMFLPGSYSFYDLPGDWQVSPVPMCHLKHTQPGEELCREVLPILQSSSENIASGKLREGKVSCIWQVLAIAICKDGRAELS
ncbi:unnamed protein product [Urochloa humidicola]